MEDALFSGDVLSEVELKWLTVIVGECALFASVTLSFHYFLFLFIGCSGRFGRGASLYRHQSQLFGRLWVRLTLPTGQFSEI